jgi:leucyl aminopeptidase
MGITIESAGEGELEADLLVVPFAEDARELPQALEQSLRTRLAPLLEGGEVTGAFGEATLVHLDNGSVRRVALAGLGKPHRIDADSVRTAMTAAVREAKRVGGTIAWLVDESLPVSAEEQARAAADGVVLGEYDPGQWRSSENHHPKPFTRLVIVGGPIEAAERAARVAEWANRARDLSNAPGNELTPERLAERAAEYAQEAGKITVEALGRDEIEELGMGAFAGVAKGAHNDPRLIVMRYDPPNAVGDVTLGLVGKAVTFDTGGISLKPALNMQNMKGDMSGGAAVIAGICAIADLKLPVRGIAVVASTENMPGGHAMRPGDILRAMNGKTIEIINTDAEGRLVLADALWYAREQGATHIADFATLTGAMALALGDFYAGLFANDDEWAEQLLEAAEASGDHLWRFPLHPRYRRYVNSTYADMKNSSDLREGSPVLAAEFLQEFSGEGPWAHLDIAGPAFLDRSRGDYLWQPGGSGYGVRLIAELASRLSA